jgi:hypothetical protein
MGDPALFVAGTAGIYLPADRVKVMAGCNGQHKI